MRDQPVFVFGSNLAGRHGAGAAHYAACYHGAAYGIGEGRTGQAYAIPTKDENLRTRALEEICGSVRVFLAYAKRHSELKFQVTAIGCGLAGYEPKQIAPMFANASANCILPQEFLEVLHELGE